MSNFILYWNCSGYSGSFCLFRLFGFSLSISQKSCWDFFFLTLYFVLEYSCLTVLWQFQVDSKGPSHTDTCIHSPPDSLPIQAATQRGAEFHVLYSRSLTALHFKHSCWDFYWNCVKSVEQLGNCSCLCMLILLIYDHDFI